jgi:hypothetical protein
MLSPSVALRMAAAVCVATLFPGCCPDPHVVLLDKTDTLQCCGDTRQYEVSQGDNTFPLDINVSLSGERNPTARFSVVIAQCESHGPADCAAVTDRTLGSAGARVSVSGRGIQLRIVVSNDSATPVVSKLSVTQERMCYGI